MKAVRNEPRSRCHRGQGAVRRPVTRHVRGTMEGALALRVSLREERFGGCLGLVEASGRSWNRPCMRVVFVGTE